MVSIIYVIVILFTILSGISKAITDLSEEQNIKGNPSYWIKDMSWVNKWKGGDKSKGEKFWGSSRWFVFLTDA